MAHWDNAAVTREGIVLLNEMMAGHELILTRACGGTGTVEVSDMVEQTGLQEEKQTLKLTDEKDGPDGKTVTVQISSLGNEAEYLLQQIGVYAKLGTDGAEKLLFIMQDEGVLIPAESDKSFLLEIFCTLRIGENGKLTVIVDPTGIVTLDRLSQTESKFDRLLGEIDPLSGTGEPDSTTPGQVGQKYEDTTSGDIYTCTAITPGESGASPHYLWVPGRLGTLAEIRTAYSNTRERLVGINLLHNSYWAAKEYIINQRGQLEYVGEQFNVVTYCIDRWFLSQASNQAKVKILDNCLEVVFDAGTVFNQRFVAPFLYNKVVTFSFLALDGQLFVFTEAFPEKSSSNNNKTKQINHNGKVYVIFMQTLPNGISEVFIYNQSGTTATLQLLGAKLELGPVQTLAHREGDTWVLNDPPPDPALELLKCQRYYIKSYFRYVCTKMKFFNQALTNVLFPVRMRGQPTVSLRSHLGTPGTLSYFNSGLDSDITAEVNNAYLTPDGFNAISVNADLVDGESYMFMYESSADL